MEQKRYKSTFFTLSTLFASFFGAAMVAGAFAYFNYKFSEYKFIDFSQWVLYSNDDLFKPDQESYLLLFYSSKDATTLQEINRINSDVPIIAIDFYQQSFPSTDKIYYLRTGTNTLLKIIQRFNIYDVPSVLIIKKNKETLYKQDSMIQPLKKYLNPSN